MQGAAGALVAATGLALLSVMFPGGRPRRVAFAILGAVMGSGTAGSFLAAAVGLRATAPPGPPPARTRIDARGAVLLTAAIAALVTGLDRAGQVGWTHPLTAGLLIAVVVLVMVFGIGARRSRDPLIPSPLIADPGRIAALLAVFVLGAGMFAGMWVLTTFLQDTLHYSALSGTAGSLVNAAQTRPRPTSPVTPPPVRPG